MKKLIIISSFIISAISFAAPNNSAAPQGQKPPMHNEMMDFPSVSGGKKEFNKMKAMFSKLTPETKKEVQKYMIDIEQKELDVKKLLLNDKVDWDKVGELNKEVGDIRAKIQTEFMKAHYEFMKEISDKSAPKQ